ncbi:zeta toxin family protein [Streptomyces hydrogenans]|uniref:zeta toxin family protein n=1 Tax=Streptomyces hydrogenans TaxID=1873719 RepID=UPI0036E057C5
MTDVDRTRYVLPEEENERIFREEIVPETLDGTSQEQPRVVIVSGQTGAGKTAITTLVTTALAVRGEPVNINLDTYKPYHPLFDELMVADDNTAGAYTSIDGHKWMEKAEAYAIERGFDVVMESAMRASRDFEEPAARFRAAGALVEVPIVAVHEAVSRKGALDRQIQQIQAFGTGRKINHEIHDACYHGVVRAAGQVDEQRLAHAVFVMRRDATVVYGNYLDPQGRWAREPDAPGAVVKERNRPWSEQESRVFAAGVEQTLRQIEILPIEMRAESLHELGEIAALARPLVHVAADSLLRRSLGSLWPVAPAPQVRAVAARSRSTTAARKPSGAPSPQTPRTPETGPQRRQGLGR